MQDRLIKRVGRINVSNMSFKDIWADKLSALFGRKEEIIPMYLIVGLGNPGKQYDMTRHNIGFHTIDYIADKYGVKLTKR